MNLHNMYVYIYTVYVYIIFFPVFFPVLLPFQPSYNPESVHPLAKCHKCTKKKWPHVAVVKSDIIEAVNLDFCVKTP